MNIQWTKYSNDKQQLEPGKDEPLLVVARSQKESLKEPGDCAIRKQSIEEMEVAERILNVLFQRCFSWQHHQLFHEESKTVVVAEIEDGEFVKYIQQHNNWKIFLFPFRFFTRNSHNMNLSTERDYFIIYPLTLLL